MEFVLTTLAVIGTDCIGSCKSNYHTITTIMGPTDYEVDFNCLWLFFSFSECYSYILYKIEV